MGRAEANGIEIEYETFGDEAAPPLLLVMGLGAQMIAWDEELCGRLADRGFFVTRYDNRDVGLSTRMEDDGDLDVVAAITGVLSGQTVDAPYLLRDMADDAFGLLDHLGVGSAHVGSAHVVGASMGGMIAQTMAITRPERVRSLTSIMSTTGNQAVGGATPEALALLMNRPPGEKDAYVQYVVDTERLLNGTVLAFDEERSRRRAARQFERAYYPVGTGRQLVAILASGDRTEALAKVGVPTLVVHGDADPLVDHSGGVATAAVVPSAELRTIPGMGHNLPAEKWDEIIDAVVIHAEQQDEAA